MLDFNSECILLETNCDILTDKEMTNMILRCSRKGSTTKSKIIESWEQFIEEIYFKKYESEKQRITTFICESNKWMKKNKVKIEVINFNPLDKDVGGAIWYVNIL